MLLWLSLPLSDKVKHYIVIALHTIKRQPYGSCRLPITRLQNMIISYNKIQHHVLTISHHLYWLHVMFILYASYFSLIDGSIIRWSLTKFQGISVLPEYAPLRKSSCRDTTWWSGVISSTFTYNGCKPVLHTQNTRVKLDEPSIYR